MKELDFQLILFSNAGYCPQCETFQKKMWVLNQGDSKLKIVCCDRCVKK